MSQSRQILEIESLFQDVRQYRKSENFKAFFDFCVRFKNLSPYNAALAQLQCPEARFLRTRAQWRSEYGRRLRTNARAIVTLRPFGPISMVFDIGDTIEDEEIKRARSEESILAQVADPFWCEGIVPYLELENLIDNLQYYGIAYERFSAASTYGAKIEVNHEKTLEIPVVKNDERAKIYRRNEYLISINKNASETQLFASMCHELGHFFCHHLRSPNNEWWECRGEGLSHSQREFEAETTAWLVCRRAGVTPSSDFYLAGYTDSEGNIPNINITFVLLAVGEIEHMIKEDRGNLRLGFLYKYSKRFKDKVDAISREHEESI